MALWQSVASYLIVLVTAALIGAVLFSHHNLSTLRRTPHQGLQMDMLKDIGKRWFRHVHKPGEVAGDDTYEAVEYIAAGVAGFYPGKLGSPILHIHPDQDEEFEVLEGSFVFSVDGREGRLSAGEKATIPKGAAHTFWNAAEDQPLKIRVRLIPGLGGALFYQNFAGIMRDSEINNRAVNPVELMALAYEYNMLIAEVPQAVRVPVHMAVHAIAPMLGYKFAYRVYEAASEVAAKSRGHAEERQEVGSGEHEEL